MYMGQFPTKLCFVNNALCLNGYTPIVNPSYQTISVWHNSYIFSLPNIKRMLPPGYQSFNIFLQECADHLTISTYVEESCCYWFALLVNFNFTRYKDSCTKCVYIFLLDLHQWFGTRLPYIVTSEWKNANWLFWIEKSCQVAIRTDRFLWISE